MPIGGNMKRTHNGSVTEDEKRRCLSVRLSDSDSQFFFRCFIFFCCAYTVACVIAKKVHTLKQFVDSSV